MATIASALPAQMNLFGSQRGTDLALLRSRMNSLQEQSCSESTVRGYSADWNSFAEWCGDNELSCLPASADTVAMYVTSLLDGGKKVSTALHHLAAITDSHRRAGKPVPAMTKARRAARKIKKTRLEQPARKAAMSPENLLAVSLACDATTARGARDRAVVVLGFASGMRRSELGRLLVSDVKFGPLGHIDLLIRRSKTDQAGAGRSVGVWPGQREETDPFRVLQAWIGHRGNWDGPLLCEIFPEQSMNVQATSGLSGNSIAKIIKTAVSRAGLDPAPYAGHSLRSGFVTSAIDLGRNELEIAKVTGHRSASMMRVYFRSNGLFVGRNPIEGLL
jgi:site-specific recombinase XerD